MEEYICDDRDHLSPFLEQLQKMTKEERAKLLKELLELRAQREHRD